MKASVVPGAHIPSDLIVSVEDIPEDPHLLNPTLSRWVLRI